MTPQFDATDALIREYPDVTCRYCVRLIYAIAGGRSGTVLGIDDMAQETAIRFWQYAKREKSGGRVIQYPKQALRNIARNVYAEFDRKHKRDRRLYELLQLQQQILEIPFRTDESEEHPPIKREFLSRVRQIMSAEDQRLYSITYASERRTMAEQAEILGKTTRAHTMQKNRFFSKLHKVRRQMVSDRMNRLASFCDDVPLLPNKSLHDEIMTLAVTDIEKLDYRMLVLFWNSILLHNAALQVMDEGGTKGGVPLSKVCQAYYTEACRFFPRKNSLRPIAQDFALRAAQNFAIGRLIMWARLDSKRMSDLYRELNSRAAALLNAYGGTDAANHVLNESAGFLRIYGWEETADSLREYAEAEDLDQDDPFSGDWHPPQFAP